MKKNRDGVGEGGRAERRRGGERGHEKKDRTMEKIRIQTSGSNGHRFLHRKRRWVLVLYFGAIFARELSLAMS